MAVLGRWLLRARELGARIARAPAGARASALACAGTVYETRTYSVTVDAHPREESDGSWVIGDTTVRVRFQCCGDTHVLRWPDQCRFPSRLDAERNAYLAGLDWAHARYDATVTASR
jgi:hypothetical protein